jgi:hypothetical protein
MLLLCGCGCGSSDSACDVQGRWFIAMMPENREETCQTVRERAKREESERCCDIGVARTGTGWMPSRHDPLVLDAGGDVGCRQRNTVASAATCRSTQTPTLLVSPVCVCWCWCWCWCSGPGHRFALQTVALNIMLLANYMSDAKRSASDGAGQYWPIGRRNNKMCGSGPWIE